MRTTLPKPTPRGGWKWSRLVPLLLLGGGLAPLAPQVAFAQVVGAPKVVRERAAAAGKAAAMDITSAQVNIDFILDERSRELGGEQTRWFDLVRTGKLLERVKKYVPAQMSRTSPGGTYGSAAAANIQPYHVLRPIPQQEIDRTSGKIVQNPG